MAARVLFVGFDAVDPSLLERWAGEGHLAVFTSLSNAGASFRLANPIRTLPGGLWQELNTGRSCGRTGVFFPDRQLHTGETDPRPVEASEVDPRAYWTAASDAGQRVAVFDLPHTVPPAQLNGIFVAEWGTHDRVFGQRSVPTTLLDEIRAAHGDYPLWTRQWPRRTTAACDGHDGSLEQYSELVIDLLAGIDRKSALLRELLQREDWDLFACAFSEGQCSGHQLWHFLDAPAPIPERLANGIRSVYERLDTALGNLIEAAGPDATVFLAATHGFVDPTGGRQLIPEVLVRLGYSSGRGASAQLRSRVPKSVRALARRLVPRGPREKLQVRTGTLAQPLESPLTRAVALDGDRCSWIRLNLKGREPYGTVAPGSEAEEILQDIRTELLLLEQPETGQRIVSQVATAREAFSDHHPDVPDLIVDFRTDLGVLEACRSVRAGLVRVPMPQTAHRTGAHPAVPCALWIRGRQDAPRATPEASEAVDLAPTILSRLGLEQPDWLEGKPLA